MFADYDVEFDTVNSTELDVAQKHFHIVNRSDISCRQITGQRKR